MPGYLDEYGVSDAKRERNIKRILIGVAVLAVVGLGLWLFLRNYPENRQMRAFLNDLKKGDYRAAYALWGCTEVHPCKDYPFEKFMEDWGPSTGHDNASVSIRKNFRESFSQSCTAGVIYVVGFSKGDPVTLWVDRKDQAVGFAPWPVCNPAGPVTQ
jgi:hypothetical protein